MKNQNKKSFFAKLRNNFIAGIVVLIPIGITLYLTLFIIKISGKIIPKKINPNNQQVDENIIICNVRLKNFKWVEEKFINLQGSKNLSHDLILSYSYLLLNKKNFNKGFFYFDARLKTNEFSKKNRYHYNIIKTVNKQKKLEKMSN